MANTSSILLAALSGGLAYTSNESGATHILVRPFPEGAQGGGQAQISTLPGRFAVGSGTAKEIPT
jgi:hypothetical protein